MSPTAFLQLHGGAAQAVPLSGHPLQHSAPGGAAPHGPRRETATPTSSCSTRARRLMPDVSLRSAFIVGFPGETEEQFEHSAGLRRTRRGLITRVASYTVLRRGRRGRGSSPRVRTARGSRAAQPPEPMLASCAERKHAGGWSAPRVEVMIDSRWSGRRSGEGSTAVGRTEGQAPEVDGVTYIEGELPDGDGTGRRGDGDDDATRWGTTW